jgi:hypothetical protein
MTALMIIIAVATLFIVVAWSAGTVYRLYFPEAPAPGATDPAASTTFHFLPRRIPVGARDIREEQRRVLTVRNHIRYAYTDGYSRGVPDVWLEDLHVRRN